MPWKGLKATRDVIFGHKKAWRSPLTKVLDTVKAPGCDSLAIKVCIKIQENCFKVLALLFFELITGSVWPIPEADVVFLTQAVRSFLN